MKATTVILANGAFPRKGGEARRILEEARRIIACDGAADTLRRRMGREADFIVGDLDSLKDSEPRIARIARIEEQETNDLAKAIRFCRARGWKQLVIVGATGKREDHSLGNIFRAMEADVPIVTDEGRFLPFSSSLKLKVRRGQPISIFATDRRTKMHSSGLEWSLDSVRFDNLYCATLNRATANAVSIVSNHPAFIYLPL